jgi:hypothetical protein
MMQNPRGIGIALFAAGLLVYGVVASDGQAVVIALLIVVLGAAIFVVLAAVVARRGSRRTGA